MDAGDVPDHPSQCPQAVFSILISQCSGTVLGPGKTAPLAQGLVGVGHRAKCCWGEHLSEAWIVRRAWLWPGFLRGPRCPKSAWGHEHPKLTGCRGPVPLGLSQGLQPLGLHSLCTWHCAERAPGGRHPRVSGHQTPRRDSWEQESKPGIDHGGG